MNKKNVGVLSVRNTKKNSPNCTKKENKGITLVALIITIIVLLILAVVAINAVTGDRIIQHATNAKTSYEKAQDEEQDVLSYYGQYLDNKGNAGDWVKEETTIKNIKTGQKLKIGDIVNYKPIEGATDSNLLQCTSTTEKTGVTGTQTFNANNYIGKWRILGTENGNILLISADIVANYNVTTEKICLNGVYELNKISSIYGHGNGAKSARSIKMKDVEKLVGFKESDRSLEKYGDYGKTIKYEFEENNKIKYVTGDTEGYIANNYDVYYIENNSWKKLEADKTFTSDYYSFKVASNYNGDEEKVINVPQNIYDVIFKKIDGSDIGICWCADLILGFNKYEGLGTFVGYGSANLATSKNVGHCGQLFSIVKQTEPSEKNWGVRVVVELENSAQLNISTDKTSYDISVN